jgi:membrane-associated phospholipid phosphatase
LRDNILGLGLVYGVCWSAFVLFPVQGPRYLWAPSPLWPHGPVRELTLHLLSAGSSRGAAFPSSHVAVAAVQAVVLWRTHRVLGAIVAAATVAIGLGAVYGGFHYAIDAVAGAALGAALGTLVVVCRMMKVLAP